MILATDAASLARIGHPGVRRLVALRMAQLAEDGPFDPTRHGRLIVAEAGDPVESLEVAFGWPLMTDPDEGVSFGHPDFVPTLEVMEEHPDCFELGQVLSDDGFCAVLFVPKPVGVGAAPGADSRLLSLCRAHAQPARDASRG